MNSSDEHCNTTKTAQAVDGVRGVCPQCGYRALAADDPLLTSHGGLGECPRCGIIPQKYLQKQQQAPAELVHEEDVLGIVAHVPDAPSGAVEWWRALLQPRTLPVVVAVLLVAGLAVLYFKRPAGEPEQVSSASVAPAPDSAATSRDPLAALRKARDAYRASLGDKPDIATYLSAARTASVSLRAIPHGDPVVDGICSQCIQIFDTIDRHLSECESARSQLASVESDIAYAKTAHDRELESARSDVESMRGQLGGMTEPLHYNTAGAINGNFHKRMEALNQRKRDLYTRSHYSNRVLDKAELECWMNIR